MSGVHWSARFRLFSAFLTLPVLLGSFASRPTWAAPDDMPTPPKMTSAEQEAKDKEEVKTEEKKAAVAGAIVGATFIVGALFGGQPSAAAKKATQDRCNAIRNAGPGAAQSALKNPPGGPAPATAQQHRVVDSPQTIPEIGETLKEANFPGLCSKITLSTDAELCQKMMGQIVTDLKKYWDTIQKAALTGTSLTLPPKGQLFPGQSGDYSDTIFKDFTATEELTTRQAHENRFTQITERLLKVATEKANTYKALGKSDQTATLQISASGQVSGSSEKILDAIIKKFQAQVSQWKFRTDLKPPPTEAEKKEGEKIIKSDIDKLVRRRVIAPEWQVWASAEAYLKDMKARADKFKEKSDEEKKSALLSAVGADRSRSALKSDGSAPPERALPPDSPSVVESTTPAALEPDALPEAPKTAAPYREPAVSFPFVVPGGEQCSTAG